MRALVAMSGGVDSSVAAALMVEAGYDVTGVMLKLWTGEVANTGSGCCNVGAADDARRVADKLAVPFYVLNLAERFESTVVADFDAAYAAGRTPNPCVRCNQWIKFDALLERADALGADVLVTGHYARVRWDERGWHLLRGEDPAKDQSYVLWMLGQEELSRCRFPVGEMTKPRAREIAESLGLRTAHKPDSQEICFVRGGDFDSYAAERIPGASVPGPISDSNGSIVGEHKGATRYTIGQRKGVGVSLGTPVFVTGIDVGANTVTIGTRAELAVGSCDLEEVSLARALPEQEVLVQYRAHGAAVPARLVVEGGRATIHFPEPPYAVAPGQSAAFYSASDPSELLGGGVIASTSPVMAAHSA